MTNPRTKTFYYRDNTGGSNLRSNEVNINQSPTQTEMSLIQNMDIYREGGFQAQLGNRQLNTGVTDTSAVLSIGQLRKNGNTYAVYTKASGTAYRMLASGGSEPAIMFSLNPSGVARFIEYNGKVVVFDGVNQPWSWPGSGTGSFLTGTPAAWATTPPSTADVDGGKRIFAAAGSTVYYCALGNENDWTTASDAGSFSNVFNDNSNITNITNYGAQIAIHTGKPAIYLLSGSAPSSYALNRIASNRAATGKAAACTAQDYQYFFSGDMVLPVITTELGVVKLGKDYDISRKIKPFITGTETELPINPVDSTSYASVILLPYDFKNQLLCYFRSVGSSAFDTCAIYNLDNGSWIFRKATVATCAARVGDKILIGTSDGKILEEFYGTTVVSGTFQKRVLSPFFDFGAPDRYKQIVRFYIVFKSTTNLSVTFNLYSDYGSTLKYTQDITSTGITSSSYGTAIYGESTYASSQILDIQFPINLQAKAFQFELLSADSTVDFRVLYYAFEVEFLDAH